MWIIKTFKSSIRDYYKIIYENLVLSWRENRLNFVISKDKKKIVGSRILKI